MFSEETFSGLPFADVASSPVLLGTFAVRRQQHGHVPERDSRIVPRLLHC